MANQRLSTTFRWLLLPFVPFLGLAASLMERTPVSWWARSGGKEALLVYTFLLATAMFVVSATALVWVVFLLFP